MEANGGIPAVHYMKCAFEHLPIYLGHTTNPQGELVEAMVIGGIAISDMQRMELLHPGMPDERVKWFLYVRF